MEEMNMMGEMEPMEAMGGMDTMGDDQYLRKNESVAETQMTKTSKKSNTSSDIKSSSDSSRSTDKKKKKIKLAQYSENDGKQMDYKVPQIKGEKTIICWNCNTVLMIKEDWNLVQCTNCEKVNRVPNAAVDANKQINLNNNLNHFELYIPHVFIIVTCPFCKTDNKARKDAEHMVCYKCHNSVSIQKENKNDYSSGSNNMNGNPYILPQKSMRFSDMFFPDPMFYPGYYPLNSSAPYNPYHPSGNVPLPYNDPYFGPELDYLYKKKVRYGMMKDKLNKPERRNEDPLVARYKAIKELLDHHDEMAAHRKNSPIGNGFRPNPQSTPNYKNDNNYLDGIGNQNNYSPNINPLKNSYNLGISNGDNSKVNLGKNDAIYKTMFTPKKY